MIETKVPRCVVQRFVRRAVVSSTLNEMLGKKGLERGKRT
jgi:hypothetical protein